MHFSNVDIHNHAVHRSFIAFQRCSSSGGIPIDDHFHFSISSSFMSARLTRAKSALKALFYENSTISTRLRRTMASSALSSPMTLSNESKTKIPKLLYGTAWKKDRTADLVYNAIKAGFRGIDTAAQPRHYQEHLVGDGIRRAISEGIVKREDLYVRFFYFMFTYRMMLIANPDPNKIHWSRWPRPEKYALLKLFPTGGTNPHLPALLLRQLPPLFHFEPRRNLSRLPRPPRALTHTSRDPSRLVHIVNLRPTPHPFPRDLKHDSLCPPITLHFA